MSLTQFQDELMASLGKTQVSVDAFVAINLDESAWLIDLQHLKEASVPTRIARNAGAPTWVVGIANFKGEVWTIVDMRVLIKGQPTNNPSWGWVTLLHPQDDHRLALLWSEIVEIAPKEEYHPDPYLRPEPWCKGHWKDKTGRIWRELDVQQLVGPTGLINTWRQRPDPGGSLEKRDEHPKT